MRWLWNNLSTLALSLLLAVVVWVVALNEENPIIEGALETPVIVELLNTPPDLIRVGEVLTQTRVTLRAPQSMWETLTAADIHVTADLSALTPGVYDLPLTARVDEPLAQIVSLSPASLNVTLEQRATREINIRLVQIGEVALGYEAGEVALSSPTVKVTGPASAVDRVSEVLVSVSIASLKRDLITDAVPIPVDTVGKTVTNVALNPNVVQVAIPITQKQGYRDVAVSPVITGQVASGYRITNITVSPLVVTLTSSDPALVSSLAGFVETLPLDISGKSDDVTERLALDLPPGVSPVGEQNVLVVVSIAAIEGSLTVPRQLEIQGLGPGLAATASPAKVDVLLFGPLPVLDTLQEADVRVILDLTGLGIGTYQIPPQISLLPDQLRAASLLPSQVEVVITRGGTPTPTLSPTHTPTSTYTPRPTLPPTQTPSLTPTETETPPPSP